MQDEKISFGQNCLTLIAYILCDIYWQDIAIRQLTRQEPTGGNLNRSFARSSELQEPQKQRHMPGKSGNRKLTHYRTPPFVADLDALLDSVQ